MTGTKTLQKTYGEGGNMWIDFSKWAEHMKILMSRANVHQKAISAEEEFNNQVNRIVQSVDSQPLSPTIPVIDTNKAAIVQR